MSGTELSAGFACSVLWPKWFSVSGRLPLRKMSRRVLIRRGSDFAAREELPDMTLQRARSGSGSEINDKSAEVCDGRVKAG